MKNIVEVAKSNPFGSPFVGERSIGAAAAASGIILMILVLLKRKYKILFLSIKNQFHMVQQNITRIVHSVVY
jgi:hypothetical protein